MQRSPASKSSGKANPYVPPGTNTNSPHATLRLPLGQRRGPRLPWLLLGVAVLWVAPLFVYRPGSSGVNDVIIRGRIITDDGHPLAQEDVEILLPEAYGLAPSEMAEPARFGNETRLAKAVTDQNGEFSCSLGPIVYHVDNYYIPFHIRVPARAPALGFLIRLPRISSDYYAIRARQGSYKTISEDGCETHVGATPLVSLTAHEELSDEHADWRDTFIGAMVELRYASTAAIRAPAS